MPTLYALTDLRELLTARLEESEGVLTPEMETELDELDGKNEHKIERCALWMREQQLEADALKAEEERLLARRKARETAAESLKGYLKAHMERLGRDRGNRPLATVALPRSPPASATALSSADPAMRYSAGDHAFITEVPASYRLNRDAVLAAWKAGAPIPPTINVTQNLHLRIK